MTGSVGAWALAFSKAAAKDANKLAAAGLKPKTQALLNLLRTNPWQNPPPYEKLVGELAGAHSRRINLQHRLVYRVNESEKQVDVLRMWTHYEQYGLVAL